MKRIVACFIAILLIIQCAHVGEIRYADAAKKPKLNKSSITLNEGDSKQLKVKGTTKKIKWKSSNKKIAKVSKKGKVIAQKAGKATITAKAGKRKLKCRVTVIKKVNTPSEDKTTYRDNTGYKEEVVVNQISDKTDCKLLNASDNNCDIQISKGEKSSTLKIGDVVVLPSDRSGSSQIVTKITDISENENSYTVSGTKPELSEVFDEIKIDNTCKVDMASFSYNADLLEKVDEDVVVGGLKMQADTTLGEDETFKIKEISIGKYGKLNGSVTICAPEINADIDVSFLGSKSEGSVKKLDVTLKEKAIGEANVTFSRGNSGMDEDFNMYLGHACAQLGYGFFADVFFYLTIRAEGKATIMCSLTDTYKLSYNKKSGLDSDNDLDISFEGTEAEVNAELLFNPQLGIRFVGVWDEYNKEVVGAIDIIKAGVYVGPGLDASFKVHDTAPYTCANIVIYGSASATIYDDVGVAKIVKKLFPDIKMTWVLLGNNDKNPLRKSWHYEDGKKIDSGNINYL